VWTLGDAEVHPDLPTIKLKPIHCLPGIRGGLDIFKVDESKTSTAARVSIKNHLSFL